MDVIEEHGIAPHMVVIDHNNEETYREVLDRGYWCGFTIYPGTKMGNERMVDILKVAGAERVIVDSSAAWGKSDALAVPKTAKLAEERRIDGVISLGGGGGTAIATAAMRALHVGFPSKSKGSDDWK